MAIAEAQLQTWTALGSVAQSRDTYGIIKRALEDSKAPYAGRPFSAFLQGSYGNDTNIYSDSDVDIVINLSSCFYYELGGLNENEKLQFQQAYPTNAQYNLPDFKREVTDWLADRFGAAVKPGTKVLFIEEGGGRRNADVLVAAQHKAYTAFPSALGQAFSEGIMFTTSDGTRIVNYPKQHSDNCTSKHQATNQRFKPMVRIFKNMRNRMMQKGMLEDGDAPSYFVEGLLYNVPDVKFSNGFAETFVECYNWIEAADRTKLVCANWKYWLVRDGTHISWPDQKFSRFLAALREFWEQG